MAVDVQGYLDGLGVTLGELSPEASDQLSGSYFQPTWDAMRVALREMKDRYPDDWRDPSIYSDLDEAMDRYYEKMGLVLSTVGDDVWVDVPRSRETTLGFGQECAVTTLPAAPPIDNGTPLVLHLVEELGQAHPQRPRDPVEVDRADVALTALDVFDGPQQALPLLDELALVGPHEVDVLSAPARLRRLLISATLSDEHAKLSRSVEGRQSFRCPIEQFGHDE